MHLVYLVCLVGGSVATVLFAALGALGGIAGHGASHVHVAHGHPGHLTTHGAHTAHTAHGHGADTSHESGAGPSQVPIASHHLATAASWTLSWLSPLTLAAAALWFGGAGLIAEGVLPGGISIVALVVAVAAAVLGAALVRSVMMALLRSSTPPLHGDAVGAIGQLSAPIRADAAGEVIYTLEGLRRSAAARSVDGALLPRGTNVVIVRRERGIAWVEALDPLDRSG
jgi:membrane protein implicated in regulation of membrane protease activity